MVPLLVQLNIHMIDGMICMITQRFQQEHGLLGLIKCHPDMVV